MYLTDFPNYDSKFLEITESEWDTVLDINLKAMYFMPQTFAKYMIKNNYESSILNFSSTSVLKNGWNPYTISKSGIQSLTLGLSGGLGTLDFCKSHL